MNTQQQPQWKQTAARVSLLTTSCVVSLFGLFCLSFPLWSRSFILAPPKNNIGGYSGSELDPTCIFAVSYTFPILGCLMCLAIVALGVIGFRRGRARYLLIATVVSTFLFVFFLSTPIWSYLFIWGDGYSGTGCEIFIEQWFPTVGPLAGLALLGLNAVALALLPQKKQIT